MDNNRRLIYSKCSEVRYQFINIDSGPEDIIDVRDLQVSPQKPRRIEKTPENRKDKNSEPEGFLEDTMCKLVQFLDCDESEEEKSSKLKSSRREKPTKEIEVHSRPVECFVEKRGKEIHEDEDEPSPLVRKLQQIDADKGSKEHTFGQKYESAKYDTIQVHNLKNIKKEEDRNTDKKTSHRELIDESRKMPLTGPSQIDRLLATNSNISKGDTINSNLLHTMSSQGEMTQKNLPKFSSIAKEISPIASNDEVKVPANKRRSELENFVQDSEMYFNAVISKMNEDLNSHKASLRPQPLGPKPMKKKKGDGTKRLQESLDLPPTSNDYLITKHNRALSLKPALVEKGKENIDLNVSTKDVWYNVNRCLEKNGYAKIAISSKTDPALV